MKLSQRGRRPRTLNKQQSKDPRRVDLRDGRLLLEHCLLRSRLANAGPRLSLQSFQQTTNSCSQGSEAELVFSSNDASCGNACWSLKKNFNPHATGGGEIDRVIPDLPKDCCPRLDFLLLLPALLNAMATEFPLTRIGAQSGPED